MTAARNMILAGMCAAVMALTGCNDTTEPEPAPSVTPAPTTTVVTPPPTTKPATPPVAYYENCDEARKAGSAPLRKDAPGFRPELDVDGDGTACE